MDIKNLYKTRTETYYLNKRLYSRPLLLHILAAHSVATDFTYWLGSWTVQKGACFSRKYRFQALRPQCGTGDLGRRKKTHGVLEIQNVHGDLKGGAAGFDGPLAAVVFATPYYLSL